MRIETETRRAVLFADVCESTGLYESLGDAEAMALVGRQLTAFEAVTSANGGVLAKTLGDGVVVHFENADSAFRAACAIQAGAELDCKVAFTFGAVIAKGEDVLGDTVNVCARLVGTANPRQVLTTHETVEMLSPGLRTRCRQLYPMKVKGRVGEVTVCEVMWDAESEVAVTATLTKDMLSAAQSKRWTLKLTYEGNTLAIEQGGSVRLGRDKTNDLVVESSLASRVHARIYERDGHFVLSDLSSNGTFLRNDGHMNEIVLRREEAMLGERGWIGLGRPTVSHGDHMLRYRLERVRA